MNMLLHACQMPPNDPVAGDSEYSGDTVSLIGAGGVSLVDDGFDDVSTDSG